MFLFFYSPIIGNCVNYVKAQLEDATFNATCLSQNMTCKTRCLKICIRLQRLQRSRGLIKGCEYNDRGSKKRSGIFVFAGTFHIANRVVKAQG